VRNGEDWQWMSDFRTSIKTARHAGAGLFSSSSP
jgi:hypothetical protein